MINNNLNTIRIMLIITGLLSGAFNVFSSDTDSLNRAQPGQITFIYPLGTQGYYSTKFTNHVSINILGGMTGGTDGFEAGGLVNVDLSDLQGAQFAGLGNLVGHHVQGAQFGGLFNIAGTVTKGAQFAGLVNADLALKNGIFPSASEIPYNSDSRSSQFAGLANIRLGNIRGVQMAGLINLVTGNHVGVQTAGLVNIGLRSTKGIQLAGLVNISNEMHTGIQTAGLINYAPAVRGTQIGFINLADTISNGIPIGFISLVRKGYHVFEVEVNEVFFVNATFKTGVKPFYNIFSVGYRPSFNQLNWGITYGIGTTQPLSSHLDFSIDATATHINEGETWTGQLNLLNRLKFSIAYPITGRINLTAGISMNVAVSQLRNDEGIVTGSSLIPAYTFFDENLRKTNIRMYPGFSAGIRF